VRRIIVAAAIFIAFMATARADFQEGLFAILRADYAAALRELGPLAEQGHTGAQYFLGDLYFYGHGVPQDYAEAAHWFRKAAEQGDAGAQSQIGFLYVVGRGVSQDYMQAHMWLNLAATQGHENARKNRDIVTDMMTPAQKFEAQRLAREWKPKKQ
jgi:hypothetical protein